MLINLFRNAIHAMSKKGTLTIRAYSKILQDKGQGVGARTSDCFRVGDCVVNIKVSDTGTGIIPEVMKNIFDPFFTTKPTGEGTGLGLAVSKNIIDLHGGLMNVKSCLGKGTTFTIVLKAIKKE